MPHYDFKNADGYAWQWEDKVGTWAIVVYLEPRDWDALEPWLVYWSKKPALKFIAVVDYTGANQGFFKDKIETLKCPCVQLLDKFDSSPFAVMPMSHAPAAYRIDPNKIAQGPFYRYCELLDRVF